jgi:hypothetical protein
LIASKALISHCQRFPLFSSEAFEVDDPVSFKEAYEKRLREILLEELGPVTLEKIEKEAAELAREDAAKSVK